jgi:hypothetical protein
MYHVENPFDWMDLISLQEKANFCQLQEDSSSVNANSFWKEDQEVGGPLENERRHIQS